MTSAIRPPERNTRARTALVASVVAVAAAVIAAVWGVAALAADPAPADHRPDTAARDDRDAAPGAPPAVPPQRVPEDIAHASESGGNAVNITIDDGPDPTWTPKVLDVLRRHRVKAVFCMIGPQAKAHPDLVRKVVADGHRLCDHTIDHDTTMDRKPVAYQEQQILEAKKMIEEAAGGAKVEYYRAPGGAFTPDSRRTAASLGMRPLGWNVDSKDYTTPGTGRIVDTVERELRGGPTVLFHDGGGDRAQTVEALDRVLTRLGEQGRPTGFPVRTAPDTPSGG
ncbi:polysaccharide deacetylase family protein [Streptomyces sp. NPDC012888]|uniref:polysaccharide deacetylase family protein n=1 Tax=Streptomyces sp. NPDC012888 TaxID=3364855 RepID=UPI00369D70A4